jgi:hypothetical protein
MAITYPVDVENTQWATYRVSTAEIVKRRGKWPVADGSEIVGQDPDYVMLLHVDQSQPAYDNRLYTLNGVEGIDVENNVISLTWSTEARPIPERIIAAENEENNQLTLHVNLVREAMQTRLMVGAILNYIVDNQDFPPKVRTMSDNYVAKAVKLFQNRDRLDELIEAIENGEDPDLDAGWTAP